MCVCVCVYVYVCVWEMFTTSRLLLFGWKRQERVRALLESEISRRHTPELVSHRRHVPSEAAETMTSLATDQSKSEQKTNKQTHR